MLVKNWMSKKVITIDENDSMQDAINLVKQHKINMLPVIKKGKLTGIVTDRDLKKASASDATTLDVHELMYLISKIKIKDIMSKKPVTVPFDFTIEETASMLLENNISGAPVVDNDKQLVGVITQADIFKVIISLTGIAKKGIHFGFKIKDLPGSIKDVADIIRNYGGRMASILTSYERVPQGYRNVYIRAYGIDRSKFKNLLSDLKKVADLLYYVDHTENKREIF
ncbi:MAG: CBS and ACT domain-containing protein [Desulfobacterales bacterium]|nr:CBS and ACT domain-containing protein [Desulfobacterales bacterium]